MTLPTTPSRLRRLRAVVIVLLMPAALGAAQDTARMEQVVQSFATNRTFAGSILVARGDQVIYEQGSGRHSVASLTKQFTAAAILLLEERGRLRLGDQVKTHLPNAPAAWDGMTIFHLLTHTAGFAGMQTPPAARGAPIQGEPTAFGYIARQMERPLLTRPGETFSYTNTGYFILGHLIERASGQTYERFITDNILAPLGLKDTGLDPVAAAAMSPNTVAVTPNAAAGFSSTAADLLRWQRALYGGKVVSAASLRKMTTPYKADYGLGLYLRTVDGRRVMTHGGGAPAFANLAWFPAREISVVVLGSTPTAAAPEIAALLGTLAHGGTVTLASERKVLQLLPDVLARYPGVYEFAGGPLTVAVDGSQLAMVSGANKTPLLAESDTSFYISNTNVRVEFIRDTAGAVTEMVVHQGTIQDRARRR